MNFNPQSKNWCFTLNKPDEEKKLVFPSSQEFYDKLSHVPYVVAFVFQEEKAVRTHYQGFIRLGVKRTFISLKSVFNGLGLGYIHLERARGSTQQCVRYCAKVDTRVAGPWCFPDDGFESPRRFFESRSKRRKVDPAILYGPEHYRHPEYKPERILCAGASGIGKTTLWSIVFQYLGFSVYEVPPRSKNSSGRWISTYAGQQAVIIDEFTWDDFTVDMWKLLLDPIPHMIPSAQGGKSVYWCPYVIVCLCNNPGNIGFLMSDRAVGRRVTQAIDWSDKVMPEAMDKTMKIGPMWDH